MADSATEAISGGSADSALTAQHLVSLNLPTLFVLEDCYAVSEIGHNVAHVLRGFDDALS